MQLSDNCTCQCKQLSCWTKGFVKPPDARCTTRWKNGVVTAIPSERSAEVGGIPRHIADVRTVPDSDEDAADLDATLSMMEESKAVS